MTPGILGLGALAIAGVLTLRRKAHRAAAVLFAVGLLAVGLTGTAGRYAAQAIRYAVVNWVGSASSWALGVPAKGVLIAVTIGLAVALAIDLKDARRAGRHTVAVAATLAVLIAAGATGINGLNHLPASVRSSVTTTSVTGG